MSLTSLFNFGYLKENIKKSKAIILLCMLLLPTINGIILLMNSSHGSGFMPNIYELSGLILFGMYFIPVILSITLFNFIYKKGSIDFVLSLPISKKQIFLTNTLGGILIIFISQIINFIITMIICLINSNIIIDYRMLFDIFILCFTAYVFVFMCTNIAISVSSNKITTIVVTLLVLFLIPFISTFINTNGFSYDLSGDVRVECANNDCKPNVYYCEDAKCEMNKKNNIYSANINRIDGVTYTMPYELIKDSLLGYGLDSDINSSIVKMVILSIIYIFVGLVLFLRKKFEVVGTSFKSEKIHILVRTLTTIPIVCVAYMIIRNFNISSYDLFAIALLIVLIFTYLIIYDLITRKKVTNFFKMAICLISVFAIVIVCNCFFDDDYNINAKDVKEITFIDDNAFYIGTSKDSKVINYVLSLLLDTESVSDVYYTYNIKVSTKGGTYRFNVYADKDNYNYINAILNDDKYFVRTSNMYKGNNIFGIGYMDSYAGKKSNNNLSDMIVNKYKKENLVFNNNTIDGDDLFDITLYMYDNFNVRSVRVNVSDDKELSLGLIRYYNANTKKFLNNMLNEDDIYSYYIKGYYYGYNYADISKFVVQHLDDEFDINKEYSYVVLSGSTDKCVFVTNDVAGLNSFINKDVDDDA